MNDLVGGSAFLITLCLFPVDANGIPHKMTVIDDDEETGCILLEYVHGQVEWVEPNILQEALLSHTNDNDSGNLLDIQHSPRPQLKTTKSKSRSNGTMATSTWEPLNSLQKDDPMMLAKACSPEVVKNPH